MAGLALLVGYATQTIGLQHITGSASAFITYLLVLFVPVLVALRTRTFPCLAVCGGIALALVGLWFLTGAQLGFGLGETLTVACAASFAVHMLAVEAVAGHCDAVRVNAIQVGVVAAGSLVPGFFLGGYNFPIATWLAVLYTGVATTAVGLSFQVWGQARLDATRASLVLLLEPVFAAVVGALIADRLGPLGIVGAALIMSGIIVAEYTRLPQAEHRLPELCEARAALADC